MTRNPLREAEENNPHGAGALTDDEVAQFTAAVEYLRSVIVAAFGVEWTDQVFSGDGYVVTEFPRSGGYFDGYEGVRKTARGYVSMSASERNSEGAAVTFGRFEDAVKRYAAGVIGSYRMPHRGPQLGYVEWMWNGTTGPGVVRHSLNPPYDTDFRYFLDEEPSAWLEGGRSGAALSHGLGMSIAAFIAVIVAHPKVTAKDTTAWPKPLRP
ncbi:hypothetical protein RN2511_029920 [Rhodococcus sp. NKCM2511]|nr:hypothetical protein RN2511_029920 [Rhodococcus sp. NKCM2511]